MSGDGALDELRSAYLYRVIAEKESGTVREALFLELATSAEGQARIWAEKSGEALPAYVPDLRVRLVAALVRRFGVRSMRGVLAAAKVRGLSIYSHPAPGHSLPGSPGGMEQRHEGMGIGGNLRAAVFGVSDGLISNASLMLGVAGASSDNRTILLTGAAGLLAGAFSMAAGEWVSVRSQREMYEHQIGLERDELEEYPEEEAEELALVYTARGLPKDEALALAQRQCADPVNALKTLAREELGLNPDELGSPWGAALSSFLSFAIGAIVPLVPFIVTTGRPALMATLGMTALAQFAVGAAISLFTGRGALRDGLRMLLIGSATGGLTYVIGSLLGVGIS